MRFVGEARVAINAVLNQPLQRATGWFPLKHRDGRELGASCELEASLAVETLSSSKRAASAASCAAGDPSKPTDSETAPRRHVAGLTSHSKRKSAEGMQGRGSGGSRSGRGPVGVATATRLRGTKVQGRGSGNQGTKPPTRKSHGAIVRKREQVSLNHRVASYLVHSLLLSHSLIQARIEKENAAMATRRRAMGLKTSNPSLGVRSSARPRPASMPGPVATEGGPGRDEGEPENNPPGKESEDQTNAAGRRYRDHEKLSNRGMCCHLQFVIISAEIDWHHPAAAFNRSGGSDEKLGRDEIECGKASQQSEACAGIHEAASEFQQAPRSGCGPHHNERYHAMD